MVREDTNQGKELGLVSTVGGIDGIEGGCWRTMAGGDYDHTPM